MAQEHLERTRSLTLTSVQWRMRPSEEHEMKFLLPSRSSFCQRTDHTGSECFPVRALLMCVGRTSTEDSGWPFELLAAGAAVCEALFVGGATVFVVCMENVERECMYSSVLATLENPKEELSANANWQLAHGYSMAVTSGGGGRGRGPTSKKLGAPVKIVYRYVSYSRIHST